MNKIKKVMDVSSIRLAVEESGVNEELSLILESGGKTYRLGYSSTTMPPGTYLMEAEASAKVSGDTKTIDSVGYFERLVFLNTSILTEYGNYSYVKTDLENVKRFIEAAKECGIEMLSAVGHDATAHVFSSLTGHDIPVNRIQYKQEFDDVAIAFKMKGRPPEGKVLTVEEMEEMGYEFGILCMEG